MQWQWFGAEIAPRVTVGHVNRVKTSTVVEEVARVTLELDGGAEIDRNDHSHHVTDIMILHVGLEGLQLALKILDVG